MPTDTSWIYKDSSGAIVVTSDTVIGLANPLRDMPTNWEEIEQEWQRSESLDGVFTKVSGEYTFVGDAAHILRHFIFTYGYTSLLKFRIDVRIDTVVDGWDYETYDICDLSFEKPPISGPDYNVQAVMYEAGLAQDLKTNLDTDFEIPITGGIRVYFAGTRVKGKYNYRYADSMVRLPWPTSYGTGFLIYKNFLTVLTTTEGFRPVAIGKTAQILEPATYLGRDIDASLQTDVPFVLQNTDTQNFDLILNQSGLEFKVQYNGTTGPITALVDFWLIIQAPAQPIRARILLGSAGTTSMTSGVDYFFTIPDVVNLTISGGLDINESIFVTPSIGVYSGTTPNGTFDITPTNAENSRLSLEVNFNTAASYANGLRQYTLFKALGEKIANGNYGATPTASTFLNTPSFRIVDNYPYHTIITNGLEIKGVTNSKFKTNMGDFIKHVKALYPVGVGVENNVIFIEHLSKFYDDSVTLGNLGEATNVKITPRASMKTKIEFGYKFNDIDDILNGVDDWNTVIQYRSPGKFMSEATMEFVSPYTASVYEIERARVEEANKDTTGNKINDQLFVFSVYRDNGGGDYFLWYMQQLGGVVTGVYFPDWAYNVDISPGHIRQMQRPLINSFCYPSTLPIKYQISDRNGEMTSKDLLSLGPTTYWPEVIEKADYVPSTDGRLFADYDFEGQFIIPINLKAIMMANPRGAFDITIKGKPARIFIDNIKNRPSKRNTFDVKGRFTASTDISQFINL